MARATVMLVAPFWHTPHHVGVHRMGRFVRWLHGRGVRIVMVTAGHRDEVVETPWGEELRVRDPLGLYGRKGTPLTIGLGECI